MQNLNDVSWDYHNYPDAGYMVEATGMEWWLAYQLRYLQNVHGHAQNKTLEDRVRQKYAKTWEMLGCKHSGLLQRLVEADFAFEKVIQIDWSEPMRRIGTQEGAWG